MSPRPGPGRLPFPNFGGYPPPGMPSMRMPFIHAHQDSNSAAGGAMAMNTSQNLNQMQSQQPSNQAEKLKRVSLFFLN